MKTNSFIALEVSDDSIRMAIFAPGSAPGRLELLDHGTVPILSGSSPAMTRDAVVATSLKKMLDEKKPATRRVVLTVEGTSVFSRVVKLPPVAHDKVEQTIRHEAIQNIPFPIDEVIWDSHVADSSADVLEVLLVAVKKDVVDGLVYAVKANGLIVERMDAAPVSLANAIRHIHADSESPILLADIGSTSSNLVFVDGKHTQFRRFSASEGPVSDLALEIKRSVSFFCGQSGARTPQRILLSGDAVEPESLSEHLGLPVAPFDLGPLIEFNRDEHRPERLTVLAGSAIPAIAGSAMTLDLVPAALRQERSNLRRRPWWIACAVILMLIMAVWMAGFSRLASLAEEERTAVADRINALEEIERQLIPVERVCTELEASVNIYRDVIERRWFWIQRLEAIRARLPDGMFILSSESLNELGVLRGLRIEVVSYLDKEPEGRDVVQMLRDSLRDSDIFGSGTQVFSRPSKQLFARQFVLDVYFAEEVP